MPNADSPSLAAVLGLVDAHEKTLTGLSNYPDFIKSDTQQKTRAALVAELRRLCEDRERLDWCEANVVDISTRDQYGTETPHICLSRADETFREFIDGLSNSTPEPAHHDG